MRIRKKRTLTLLEIVIAMVLLGILLTGLFNVFHQSLKKNIAAKAMKQKVLQFELFQQRLKNLFGSTKSFWLGTHSDAIGPALFISFEEKADPEISMCGEQQGMLFFNDKKQLCFVSWPENGQGRVETLLDRVDAVKIRLFDSKNGEWFASWPRKKEEHPVMLKMEVEWDKKEIPCVFFLTADDQIAYSGPS